jgi:hypothetical protein
LGLTGVAQGSPSADSWMAWRAAWAWLVSSEWILGNDVTLGFCVGRQLYCVIEVSQRSHKTVVFLLVMMHGQCFSASALA